MTIFIILVVALIINWVISLEVAELAKTRELGKEKAFWISFFLSPLLGLLFVLASRPLTDEQVSKLREKANAQLPSEEQKQQMKKSYEKHAKTTQHVAMTLLVVVSVLFIIAINKA